MKITLEQAEAWYRGDESVKVSAHEAATFYRGEMMRLREFEPRDGESFIEVAKTWGRAQEAKEARQLVANLEEMELRVQSRESEMNRSLHNVRILGEDFRKMARPVADLRRLFAWPIALMEWADRTFR